MRVRSGGGCIVVAAEREIKFAPQTRFSSAISRYRKRGRLTNSQPRFSRKPVEFKPTRIDPAAENRGESLFSVTKLPRNEWELLRVAGEHVSICVSHLCMRACTHVHTHIHPQQ